MQHHPLIKDKFNVSTLSFGGASLSGEGGGYGFGKVSEDEAKALIEHAVDLGINLYDTAPIYGFGLSEERLGRYLPKDSWVVTKGGIDWNSNKRVNLTNSPEVIERMFFESLKRLKRDHIHIYMIHWPDPRIDIRFPLEVLAKLKSQQYISHVGLCNTNEADLLSAKEICQIDLIQAEYNLFNQQNLNLVDKFPDLGFMAWGVLDKGILSGRVHEKRTYDPSDARSSAPWWNKKEVLKKIKKVESFQKILKRENVDLLNFLFSYYQSHKNISTLLTGAKTPKDYDQLLNSFNPLSNDLRDKLINEWNQLHEEELFDEV